MTRRMSFFFAVLFVTITSFVIFYKIHNSQNDNISCTLNTQVYLGMYKLDILVKYKITESNGLSLLNGILYKNNMPKGNLNRIVHFNSSSDGNFYRFKNSRVSLTKSDSVDNEELSNILQIFFIKDGQDLNVSFERQAKGVYTVATGNVKIGVCIDPE